MNLMGIKTKKQKEGIEEKIADFRIDPNRKDLIEFAIDKIANKILFPIVSDQSKSIETAISEICSLVSNENNISVEIKETTEGNEFLRYMLRRKNGKSTKELSKKELDNAGYIKVVLSCRGNDLEINFLSILRYKLIERLNSDWKFKITQHYHLSDLTKQLASVYLANKLYEFANCNKEKTSYALLKAIKESRNYIDEEVPELNNLLEKYGLGPLDAANTKKYKWLSLIEDPSKIFNFDTLYHYDKGRYFHYCQFNARPRCLLFQTILKMMLERNEELEAEQRRYDNISSCIAKANQTKKNISQKIQKLMANNNFLKIFGYTEFDNDVDISKLSIFEQDFIKLQEQIALPLAKDHNFRIKKLGKHWGNSIITGLYYPVSKDVIVDLRFSQSFIHEVLHMIDYSSVPGINLSEMINFRPLIDRYKEVMEESLSKLDINSPIFKQWCGNSVCNKSYFYCPTEIFARCGEIYFRRILKINNSLVDECTDFAYPKDKVLESMIKNYFATVLTTVPTVEKKPEEKVASKKAAFYNIEDNGQLCLL